MRRPRALLSGFVCATALIIAGCSGGATDSAPQLSLPIATTLRPTPDGFSFPNFPGSVTPEQFDASDLVAMFGEGACVGGVIDPCDPIAEAAAWARMVNQARASGHCEGLVVEASKRFNAAIKPLTVDLANEGEVTHKIFRSFATQFFPEVQAERDEWAKKSLRQIVDEIGMSLESGTTQYTLGLYTPRGGHAVLPYAIEFTDPDHAILRVYDSNWPGKDRFVEFDLQADTWRFSFSGVDPATDAKPWTGKAGDVDIGSLNSSTNSLCPFCVSETRVKNSMVVIKSIDNNWSISTSNGTYSPSTGNVVEGIDARPIRGAVNDDKALEYVVYVQGSDMQMVLPDATSAFVMQGTAVVQVVSQENNNGVIDISSASVSVDNPNVTLTVASNNLVAAVAGTNTVIDIAPTQLNVATESSTGQKITVTASQEVPQVTARAADQATSDGITDFVVTTKTADNQTKVREVARDGSEKLSTTDKALDLNVVTSNLPDVLKSEMVKPGLPSLEARNLANPLYVADASFVPQAGVIASRTIGSRACDVPGFPSSWIIQADATTCTAPLLTITAAAKVVNTIGSECVDNGVTGVWSPFGESGSTVCFPKVVFTAQKSLITNKVGLACNEYGITGVFVAVDTGLSCQASRTLNAVDQLASSQCTLIGFPDGWVFSLTGSTCVAPVVGSAALKKVGTSCTLGDASGTWGFIDGSINVECIVPKVAAVAPSTPKSRYLTIEGISSSYSYLMSDSPPTITGKAEVGGGTISYSSSPAVVCSIGSASGSVSFVGPGMCYVTASIASDGIYRSASATQKFMVSAIDKSSTTSSTSTTTTTSTIAQVIDPTRWITVNGLSPSLSYLTTDSPPVISGTASAGGGTISYSSSPAVVCSIGSASGIVSFVGPGMCYVTASIASDGVYPATSSTAKFSITLVVATTTTTSTTTTTTTIAPELISRTLSIDSGSYTSTYALSATPPTLTSTASAGGGAKSFTSATKPVCTVENSGAVTFVAAGTCTISASIQADSTYAFATASSISFSITATSRTIAIDAGSYTSTYAMSATPPTLTSTASAGSGAKTYTSTTTSVCTVGSSSGVVAFVAAGTCTISASIAADSPYASATASSIGFSITAISRTIAVDAGSYSASYNRYATAPTLTSTASAGSGTKTYSSTTTSVCTISSSTGVVSFVTAGTCTLKVAIASDGTYISATSSTVSLTVTYAIGDAGPGGGKIFMTLSTSGNTTGKYFESALGTWNSGSDINNRWCNNTNLAIGTSAQGIAIGTGQANTNAIVAVCTAGAAVDARAYAGGGLADWFLPSQAELQAMYTQRTTIGGFTTLSQLYGGSGNTQSYWSSSEAVSPFSPATQAIPVAFNNGGGDNYGKIYGFNVRPIRMFAPIG
jgi:hypothetical protein